MPDAIPSTFGIFKDLAERVGQRAFAEMTATEERRHLLAAALKGVQEGRRWVDENASRWAGVLGLATQNDIQRVDQRLRRLRKRLRRLSDELKEVA